MTRTGKRKLVRVVSLTVVTWFVCFLMFFPFYWMIVTSLKAGNELFIYPPKFWPGQPRFNNYAQVFASKPLGLWLSNSLEVAISGTLISMALSILGGYTISRFRFSGRGLLACIVLVTQMLPSTLLILPVYMIFKDLALLDRLGSLVITYTTFAVPVCIWMLKGYFDTIPRELEEAAMVDGCSRVGALIRVILPISLPGIVATAIYSFILCWHEYLFARTLITANQNWTSPVGLASLVGQYVTPWEEIMSAAAIVTVPVVVVFIFLQKYLIHGLTSGAVKG